MAQTTLLAKLIAAHHPGGKFKIRCGLAFCLVSAALVCLCVAASAGPIRPQEQELPDPLRSLAKIEQVRIKIDPAPAKLAEAGITSDYIEGRIRRRFAEEGILIDPENLELPTVGFRYLVQTDARVEGGVAYALLLQLYQEVYIKRLKVYMEVPTYTGFIVGLEHEEDFTSSVRKSIETMIGGLLLRINVASRI